MDSRCWGRGTFSQCAQGAVDVNYGLDETTEFLYRQVLVKNTTLSRVMITAQPAGISETYVRLLL